MITVHAGRRVDVRETSADYGGSVGYAPGWRIYPPDAPSDTFSIGPFPDEETALEVASAYFAYPLCPHGEPGPDLCDACHADEAGVRRFERDREQGLR